MKVTPPRDTAFEALTHSPLDVLIIGGGIVGAGVARDAAMRGLKVGLESQKPIDWSLLTPATTTAIGVFKQALSPPPTHHGAQC